MTLGFLSRDCNSSSTIHRGNSGQHPRGTCALLVAGACAPPVEVLPLTLLLKALRLTRALLGLMHMPLVLRASASRACGGAGTALASERMPRGVSRAKGPQLLKRAYANRALALCITGNLIHNAKTQLTHTLQHHRLSTLTSTTAVVSTVHKQTKTRPPQPAAGSASTI